ncbi:DUF1080 domain-containing protein [Chitinophaga horti]|uniref:DUF1080 domain-containing protein n=1 Tax=Chitinophaga horti TaxID=2920382 RepID=A0ABY6J0X1_9BACT|nr:family 16 glycoside hydrolase [Chitinophaga horti]UYQ91869.1 DUF1080 domain-containing protein [Chitinophaga horti]
MKKIFNYIIAACLITSSLHAQAPADQRALTTRIADLLQQMPATGSNKQNSYMKEVSSLGEQGLTDMITMLAPEGKGDNTTLQYAIGGYAAYVMQPGQEQARNTACRAFAAALPKLAKDELRDFLIGQFQLIANNESVPALQPYLNNERLCDPAARALAVINTPDAQKSLLNALASASGKRKIYLISALGDTRSKAAVNAITAHATSEDAALRKISLYALARIGDRQSAKLLEEQAAKSGYTFDVTNATSSYLLYLQQSGHTELATALSKKQLPVHTRTVVLKLLSDLQADKRIALLTAAMTDKDAEYRTAALKYAALQPSDEAVAAWTKTYAKANAASKAGILSLLGASGSKQALPVIQAALKDEKVKLAAIQAAGRTGDASLVPALLNTLKASDSATVQAVKQALLTIKSEQLTSQVAAYLPNANPLAQQALLDVLAARKANGQSAAVWAALKSNNEAVSKAAYQALPAVADASQLQQLFDLLPTTKTAAQTSQTQAAIVVALAGTSEADAVARVAAEMKKAPERYLNMLAGIGGKQAMDMVLNAYRDGNEATRQAALKSLLSWKDASAARPLLATAKQHPAALQGVIDLVSRSGWTPDQKFLVLREAMEVAGTSAQKAKLLKEIEKCKTFPALMFAAKYIGDATVQQEAASAFAVIALSNKTFNGPAVRALLEKSIGLIKGADSDYQKEAIRKHIADMPAGEGLSPIFNGNDLSGWKGLVGNPISRAKMNDKQLAAAQKKADSAMLAGWSVKDGLLVFNGHGDNLCTVKKYGDFEMYVDWKITAEGDAGIYLRGTPQVQIWDTSRRSVGAQVGSGGLYNNQKNPSKPLAVADNAVGEWNNFHIIMKGDRVTVYLNGVLVTDNVMLENYWDRNLPIFVEEQLELQAHGTYVAYRDIYVREIPRTQAFALSEQEKKEGYRVLFDGTNMHQWTGNTTDYVMENGEMVIYPANGGKGNLYTKDQFSDFVYRFEFQLTPGANNGLGIRTPMEGDAAYQGMELQILDNEADIYKNLKPYQYHGSVYGVIPSKRGYLKPMGEWNYQEVVAQGNRIKITLNGTVILDGDIAEASKNNTETADHRPHPGLLNKTGHIGFLGHGAIVRFKNIRVKELKSK